MTGKALLSAFLALRSPVIHTTKQNWIKGHAKTCFSGLVFLCGLVCFRKVSFFNQHIPRLASALLAKLVWPKFAFVYDFICRGVGLFALTWESSSRKAIKVREHGLDGQYSSSLISNCFGKSIIRVSLIFTTMMALFPSYIFPALWYFPSCGSHDTFGSSSGFGRRQPLFSRHVQR